MKLGLYIFLLLSNLILYAQNEKKNFSMSPVDTVPLNLILPDHQVYTSDNEFLKKWNKTKFYIRSVYDYAKIASSMLERFNDTLALLSNNRIKKRYLKRANKMLKNEFGDDIEFITGRVYKNVIASFGTEKSSYSVRAVNPDHQFIEKSEIKNGRFINTLDIQNNTKNIVIGNLVVEDLFGDINPIGKYLDLNKIKFKIYRCFRFFSHFNT